LTRTNGSTPDALASRHPPRLDRTGLDHHHGVAGFQQPVEPLGGVAGHGAVEPLGGGVEHAHRMLLRSPVDSSEQHCSTGLEPRKGRGRRCHGGPRGRPPPAVTPTLAELLKQTSTSRPLPGGCTSDRRRGPVPPRQRLPSAATAGPSCRARAATSPIRPTSHRLSQPEHTMQQHGGHSPKFHAERDILPRGQSRS
jgi:hypothetical protein